MTRKSRREIETRLDDFDGGGDRDRFADRDAKIAYRLAEGWVGQDGNPLPENPDAVVRYGGVTMEREQAEANGYEILKDHVEGTQDCVTVPYDYDHDSGRSLPFR